MLLRRRYLLVAAISAVAFVPVVNAQAVRGGFSSNSLPGNDDGSTGAVALPFSINFLGASYSQTYVNNNGNITFNDALGTYTPFGLTGGGVPPIIAPFFADVDTRVGPVVTYGTGTVNGHSAFGVEWPGVGYYGTHLDKTNIFELVLIDRSDTGAGNFDFEFNYNSIMWETGDASGGHGGLGGSCAHAGYSNGLSGANNVSLELAGSGVCGAFLNGGPDALNANSFNSDVTGRYVFAVRNGEVQAPPTTVPEPSSLALLGTGLVSLVPMVRRRRK